MVYKFIENIISKFRNFAMSRSFFRVSRNGEMAKWRLGFTFVELMVIIAIIAVLSAISIPFYSSLRKTLTLERATAKLVQDLRRTEEMALSGQDFKGTGFPKGGYGMYFNQGDTNCTIFADIDATRKFDSSNKTLEVVSFENNVKVNSLNNGSNAKIHVIFVPPDPFVFITDSNGNDLMAATSPLTVVNIRISLIDDASKYRDIKVSRTGLIWID